MLEDRRKLKVKVPETEEVELQSKSEVSEQRMVSEFEVKTYVSLPRCDQASLLTVRTL